MSSVAVIVPTVGRTTLALSLASLAVDSRYSDILLSFIVIQDGNSADLGDLPPETQVIRLPTRIGPGLARNVGLSQTDADFVFFMDDDCVAPPNLLSALMEALTAEHRAASAAAYVRPDIHALRSSPVARLELYCSDFKKADLSKTAVGPYSELPAGGGVKLWRRKVLDELNGFRNLSVGEDWDLEARAHLAGYIGIYLPIELAHVRHYDLASLWGQYRFRGAHSPNAPLLTRIAKGILRLSASPVRSRNILAKGDIAAFGCAVVRDAAYSVGSITRK